MEATPGFAHEAVVGKGTLQKTEALSSMIKLTHSRFNRFAILKKDKNIGRTKDAGEFA